LSTIELLLDLSFCGLAFDYFFEGDFIIFISYYINCFQKFAIFELAVFKTHSLGTSFPFS
jgi:hypothetical protein